MTGAEHSGQGALHVLVTAVQSQTAFAACLLDFCTMALSLDAIAEDTEPDGAAAAEVVLDDGAFVAAALEVVALEDATGAEPPVSSAAAVVVDEGVVVGVAFAAMASAAAAAVGD